MRLQQLKNFLFCINPHLWISQGNMNMDKVLSVKKCTNLKSHHIDYKKKHQWPALHFIYPSHLLQSIKNKVNYNQLFKNYWLTRLLLPKYCELYPDSKISKHFHYWWKSIFGWSDDTCAVYDLIYSDLLDCWLAHQHWCVDRVKTIIYKKTIWFDNITRSTHE